MDKLNRAIFAVLIAAGAAMLVVAALGTALLVIVNTL